MQSTMLITGDKGASYSWSYCAAVHAFRNNQVLLRLCYSGQDTDTNRHDDNRVYINVAIKMLGGVLP